MPYKSCIDERNGQCESGVYFQYAAIILLIITAGIGGHLYTALKQKPTVTDKSHLVQTGKGQRQILPTGRHSRLVKFIYSTALAMRIMGATQRVVSLIGEAYYRSS